MIEEKTLNEWARECYEVAEAHGFWQSGINLPRSLCLIHSELSEALEEDRKGNPLLYYELPSPKPEGVAAELIDVIIRTLDLLHYYGIDVDMLMHEKMRYNKNRPHMHGKAY